MHSHSRQNQWHVGFAKPLFEQDEDEPVQDLDALDAPAAFFHDSTKTAFAVCSDGSLYVDGYKYAGFDNDLKDTTVLGMYAYVYVYLCVCVCVYAYGLIGNDVRS